MHKTHEKELLDSTNKHAKDNKEKAPESDWSLEVRDDVIKLNK